MYVFIHLYVYFNINGVLKGGCEFGREWRIHERFRREEMEGRNHVIIF